MVISLLFQLHTNTDETPAQRLHISLGCKDYCANINPLTYLFTYLLHILQISNHKYILNSRGDEPQLLYRDGRVTDSPKFNGWKHQAVS